MALEQSTRSLRLTTPLGENKLLLIAFSGKEQMSRLFRYELEMLSDEAAIEPQSIVGRPVTFSIEVPESEPRFFHGFVSQFIAGDEDNGRRSYRAEVVPWLWFLTQTADCRIFQKKSVPQIIEQIFDDLGFSAFETADIKGQHPKWEYCVQYRETDFNFVSRLMEQEGIFYYFRHEDGQHTLVLADSVGAYKECPESHVDYPATVGSIAINDHITSWEHRFQFRSGRWAQTDYNFETPANSVSGQANTIVSFPDNKKYEIYDFPAEVESNGEADTDTRIRMEEEEVNCDIVNGSSTCKTFGLAGKFTIDTHPVASEQGKTYVITSIQHSAAEQLAYETGVGAGEDYRNLFTCIPESVVFRPARLTAKPLVSGIQTAVVVGPKGEEIHCDKYGRVKVQFHWDREGKRDEDSSCWIRVAHNVAGKQWGFKALPRVGQEVVVDFLEGDPDRPLIVGSVYNAQQMPHYTLPENMTKTYIKTNSSKGGEGFNELMFEDKADDERLFLHAQKNFDIRVLNDSKARIYGNRHQIIGWEKDGKKGGDQRELIYEDQHLNVKRHQVNHIEGHLQLRVGEGESDDGGNADFVIEKRKAELVGGDCHLTVKGNYNEKIDGKVSSQVGGDLQTKVGGNVACEAGAMGEIHLKAGMNVILEAGMQLTIKAAGGFITIGPDGVSIQGIMVKINSGGSAGSGKGCQPDAPEEPEKAEPAEPEQAWNSTSGMKSAPG